MTMTPSTEAEVEATSTPRIVDNAMPFPTHLIERTPAYAAVSKSNYQPIINNSTENINEQLSMDNYFDQDTPNLIEFCRLYSLPNNHFSNIEEARHYVVEAMKDPVLEHMLQTLYKRNFRNSAKKIKSRTNSMGIQSITGPVKAVSNKTFQGPKEPGSTLKKDNFIQKRLLPQQGESMKSYYENRQTPIQVTPKSTRETSPRHPLPDGLIVQSLNRSIVQSPAKSIVQSPNRAKTRSPSPDRQIYQSPVKKIIQSPSYDPLLKDQNIRMSYFSPDKKQSSKQETPPRSQLRSPLRKKSRRQSLVRDSPAPKRRPRSHSRRHRRKRSSSSSSSSSRSRSPSRSRKHKYAKYSHRTRSNTKSSSKKTTPISEVSPSALIHLSLEDLQVLGNAWSQGITREQNVQTNVQSIPIVRNSCPLKGTDIVAFDGTQSDCVRFLNAVEAVAPTRGITLDEVIHKNIAIFLTGPAYTWYVYIKNTLSNWKDFVSKFKDRFDLSEMAKTNLLKNMKQKDGESIYNFVLRYNDLWVQQSTTSVKSAAFEIFTNANPIGKNVIKSTGLRKLENIQSIVKEVTKNKFLYDEWDLSS